MSLDIHAAPLPSDVDETKPADLIKWGFETFGNTMTVVTSFQPTGIVTLHMLQEIAPDVPVITIDTGLLFPETQKLIDTYETRFNLNLIRVLPQQSVAEQSIVHGEQLWQSDPDKCCELRKTQPLQHALTPYRAWVAGIRRDQSIQRANIQPIQWDTKHDMVKLCPFAHWTDDMIWAYIHTHDLPTNDLHDQGYPSIGCIPCTQAATCYATPRSGRWVGHPKTECGLHTSQTKTTT